MLGDCDAKERLSQLKRNYFHDIQDYNLNVCKQQRLRFLAHRASDIQFEEQQAQNNTIQIQNQKKFLCRRRMYIKDILKNAYDRQINEKESWRRQQKQLQKRQAQCYMDHVYRQYENSLSNLMKLYKPQSYESVSPVKVRTLNSNCDKRFKTQLVPSSTVNSQLENPEKSKLSLPQVRRFSQCSPKLELKKKVGQITISNEDNQNKFQPVHSTKESFGQVFSPVNKFSQRCQEKLKQQTPSNLLQLLSSGKDKQIKKVFQDYYKQQLDRQVSQHRKHPVYRF